MVLLILLIFFSSIYFGIDNFQKTNEIKNLEKLSFSEIPWGKIYKLRLDQFNSVNYQIIKNGKQKRIYFTVNCLSLKYKIKFVNKTKMNNDLLNLVKDKTKNEAGKKNQLNLFLLKKRFKNYLYKKGYLNNDVSLEKSLLNGRIIYYFTINLGKLEVFQKIEIGGNLPSSVNKIYNKKFKDVITSNENIIQIVNDLNSHLKNLNFKFFSISYTINQKHKKFILSIYVKNIVKVYISAILKNRAARIEEIHDYIYSSIKTINQLNKRSISKIINDLYESKGWFKIYTNIRIVTRINNLITYKYIYIKTSKGFKKNVKSVSFRNAGKLSRKLLYLYFNSSNGRARAGYYDKQFVSAFKIQLENYLYSIGYVYSSVYEPFVKTVRNSVKIIYTINLGKQIKISSIKLFDKSFIDIPKDLVLFNKINENINITKIKSDLNSTLNYYRSKGFLFANTFKINAKTVRYFNNQSEIIFPIHRKKIARLKKIKIFGLLKTKAYVIWREIKLKPDDIITSKKINNLKNTLFSMGIFKNVSIKIIPLSKNINKYQDTNIEIHLKEKNFGSAEIKPGFRSDLGYKLGLGVSYNNLFNIRHRLVFSIDGNKRINNSSLDPKRISKRNNFVEFKSQIEYTIPYLVSNINLVSSISKQKFMFFPFDANISKLRETATKRLNKNFELYTIFQFENINQFNATVSSDNGEFKIGSFSFGLVIDFRNRHIFPSRGFFGNYAIELSHPALGSLSTSTDEINFYKILIQNRYYKEIYKNILAISVNVGFEKNLSKGVVLSGGESKIKGYIPSIKVFRLAGIDSVRGYQENEINLVGGKDISEYRISSEASYISAKIEYRIPLSENLYAAPFFDFGSVYINRFSLLKVRKSFGAVIKFLTPVGTLDISYGLKLNRKKNSEIQETFGELNLLIGFF